MSVKINGHTIASKLRKMFSSNGQTVASNLDGEIPSGSGSGGSDSLVVEFDYENGIAANAQYVVSNIPAKDIIAAYSSGRYVLFKFAMFNDGVDDTPYFSCASMSCLYVWGEHVQAEGTTHPKGQIYYDGSINTLSGSASEVIVDFDAPVKFGVYWD